mgnify:FL=1
MSEAKWYVVHTYSGYENKVKMDIEKTIENRNLQDQILEVVIPLENVVEEKNGAKKQVSKKLFPAYVLINMVMNEDTWYVVRNTRGVTGFVGPGSKPVPLTDEEYKRMLTMTGGDKLSFEVGDNVVVVSGVWENSTGVVQSISENRQIVTINIDMFGRETPVELDFVEVEKV